jgi:hypothetical protein
MQHGTIHFSLFFARLHKNRKFQGLRAITFLLAGGERPKDRRTGGVVVVWCLALVSIESRKKLEEEN